jgi:hypothetical protein
MKRSRTRRWSAIVSAIALGASLAALASPPGSSAATSCRPPRGPGDDLVHSEKLRAGGVGCDVARQVVLASTNGAGGRFSEGAGFTVAGERWRCYASPFPGSHQRCTSSSDAVVSIIWID